jgi:ech hydrogenase subunit D
MEEIKPNTTGIVVENEACVIGTPANAKSEPNQFVASCINGNYPRRVIDIMPENLTNEILKTKYEGFRLVQMCAVNTKDGIMLNYSFGREYELLCYHLNIDIDTPVMSISEIFPPAFIYENEIHDLFGVKIEHISLDFEGNLYRLENKTPFMRKGDEI